MILDHLQFLERQFMSLIAWYGEHGFLLGLLCLLCTLMLFIIELRRQDYLQAALSALILLSIGITLPPPAF